MAGEESQTKAGYRELKVIAEERCYHEHGDYAGLCELPIAVLREGSSGFVAVFEGRLQSAEVLDGVLSTFHFVDN